MKILRDFFKALYFLATYLFLKTAIFFRKLNVKAVEKNWRISKNRNFYNPTLQATVYKYGPIWKIARFDEFFGHFDSKEEAMGSIFQTWLEENKSIEKINKLETKLKNLKLQSSNSSENVSNRKLLQAENEYYSELNTYVTPNFNFKADYFYLAQAPRNCYKCNRSTLVNAIILPEGFETIDHYTMDELEAEGVDLGDKTLFCSENYLSLLSYVTYISPDALEQIYSQYTNKELFHQAYSATTRSSYYRSICNYCGAAQGDNYVISEFDSTFRPVNIKDFEKIQFHKIEQKIKICAGENSVGYEAPSEQNNLNVFVSNIYKN
jgi:hypothetical protein